MMFFFHSLFLVIILGTTENPPWTRRTTCAAAAAAVIPETDKIWLPGATGSGPFDVAQAWSAAFSALYPEAALTLTSVGSGAAQKALWGDIDCQAKPVEAVCALQQQQDEEEEEEQEESQQEPPPETVWGLGDAPFSSNVYSDHPALQLQQFPACAGAIAVMYSKEKQDQDDALPPLRTNWQVLSGIFNRTIRYWDDPALLALNPHLRDALSHQRISVVVRQDSSGQTSIFTDALDYHSGRDVWPPEAVGKQPQWPLGTLVSTQETTELSRATCRTLETTNTTSEKKNDTLSHYQHYQADGKNGIALGMLRVPYSIGYMEMGFAQRFTDFLGMAEIANAQTTPGDVNNNDDNHFQGPSAASLVATMDGLASYLDPETLELNLARAPTPPGGYPISGYAYWYVKRAASAYTSCYQAWLVCKFVEWSYTDPQAATLALQNAWVVPPPSVVEKTLAALRQVQCWDEAETGEILSALDYVPPRYRSTADDPGTDWIVVVVTTFAAFLVVVIFTLWCWERRRRHGDHIWMVQKKELIYGDPPEIIGEGSFGTILLAEYRGAQVAVKRFASTDRQHGSTSADHRPPRQKRNSQSEMARLDSTTTSLERKERGTFWMFGSLGKGKRSASRAAIIREMRIMARLRHPCVLTVMGAVIDWGQELLLVLEYMEHGSFWDLLHNETMVLDGEILVPILQDIAQGLRFLHAATPQVIHGDLKAKNVLIDRKFRAKVADFGLSSKAQNRAGGTLLWMAPELLNGTSKNSAASDVYSFGILLYEAFSRRDPYDGEDQDEVIQQVADPNVEKRPPVPVGMPHHFESIMEDCLDYESEQRPTAQEIDQRLKRAEAEQVNSQGPLKVKDSKVSLFDIFPRHVAEALRDGRTVKPEHRDCVTIFFSDIVGFTNISSTLPPQKVAAMLDRLYTKFDSLSAHHDVFKVETIGDAYVAVANLVKDQPDDHAKRIACFALDAVMAANEIMIDEEDVAKGFVTIRCGFHSGPIVADVVGTRNPRYCLFGDTMNIASRMESNSKENRIQCSKESAKLLEEQYPELPLLPRGKISIKGKGRMNTFWVNETGKRRHSDIRLELEEFRRSMERRNDPEGLAALYDEGSSEMFSPQQEMNASEPPSLPILTEEQTADIEAPAVAPQEIQEQNPKIASDTLEGAAPCEQAPSQATASSHLQPQTTIGVLREIVVPPGKQGICFDITDDATTLPRVTRVEPWSPLNGSIHPGDELLAIDGVSANAMQGAALSALMSTGHDRHFVIRSSQVDDAAEKRLSF